MTVRPTRAEIDLSATSHNAREIKKLLHPQTAVFAVVKADAYGHGAVAVGSHLVASRAVDGLAVSLVEEGIELREAGVAGPILVMAGPFFGAHQECLLQDLCPVVSTVTDVREFAKAARELGRTGRVHLKADTGMSRLGSLADDFAKLLAVASQHDELVIDGLCTHLAWADDASDKDKLDAQLARFSEIRALCKNITIPIVHAANSSATVRTSEAQFDAVRPGLAIYGCGPTHDIALRPAMRLTTQIVQLKEISSGTTVSYGGLWTAKRRSLIATLPVGYADGYPRRLSNLAHVLVRETRCPVIGAVCMDMMMVDVTALRDTVAQRDEVCLLGSQGNESISAAELANHAGLIEYEILCGVSKRVPRVYTPVAKYEKVL